MQQMIVLGEVFWDHYENDSYFLGGSALNVAWHLKGLGLNPALVSRLGNDELGKKMTQAVQHWGISSDYLQTDSDHVTGVIEVLMDVAKKPTFITPPDISMDYIEENLKINSLEKNSILWHGSFVLRNKKSGDTVRKIKKNVQKVFMDLNLRAPYWSHELIDEWVRDLEYFKLSDDEFVLMTKKENLLIQTQVDWLQEWMGKKNIKNVLFTLGSKGSFWIREEGVCFSQAEKISVIDTVGAGDAFCSGILYSIHQDLPMQESLNKASKFAAEICKLHGATSPDKKFYQSSLRSIWKKSF